MSVLVTQRLLTLNAATPLFQSAPVAVDPLTDAITLRLRRPTTAAPLAWLATAVLRVSLVLVIDGEEFVCSGEVSGGIRLNGLGIEIPDYRLVYQPTVHWTGGQSRRIGQRTQTAITAYVKLERLRGSIATELLFAATTESPPPDMSSHNSVAFDAATSATEQGGDGVLSLSHTAGGADRAAFIGVSVAFSGDSGGTVTYGGNAATSLFEDDSTQIGVSGFYYVAPPASAQTVTSDLVATAPFSHNLHVISMTGVDPTTPVGTPVVVTAGFDTNPSVTVGSVGADDLVVDVMACTIANSGVTIGASQTQRTIQDNSGPDSHRTSTQSGANGGVMSWTYAGSTWRSLGAVAFKPAAPATVALTGTAAASITEADIVAGGKTIILTVTDDTVVPASQVQTIGFIANALGGTTTTTTFSITLPTTQAGDILVLEFCHRGTADGTIGGTSITTGGLTWTQVHSQLFATSTFSGKLLWTRATGDHSGQTVTGSGLTNACAAIVTQYRNCVASGDPFANAATIVGEQNASGNVTQAEITTLVDGCMVCLTVLNSPDLAVATQACTTPGALAERAERLSTGGTDASIAHASEIRTAAGATGAFTWTQTAAASGSYAYALQPAVTTPFADARAAIISGIDSAQAEGAGWDAKVKPNIPVGNVVRTSNTVITITLQAQADYDITAQETITATVPASALVGNSAVVATPTFTIDPAAGSIGAASGTSSATATGIALKPTVGSSAGTSTVAATGRSTAASVGASSGTGAATGVSLAIHLAAGSSAGTGTATATGLTIVAGVGASAGTSTAAATAQSTAAAIGAATGTSTALAIGSSTTAAAGSSAGTSTALGVGRSTFTAIGAAAGTSTVTSVSIAIVSGVGSAAGTGAAVALAEGEALISADGLASGTSTATATGSSVAASVGSVSCLGVATGVGGSTFASAGNVAANSTVLATGSSTHSGIGTASGSGSASAVGVSQGTASGAGSSAGIATVLGIATSTATAAGLSAAVSTALGFGTGLKISAGTSTGLGTAAGAGRSTFTAAGLSEAIASAFGFGVGIQTTSAVGSAAGTGTAAAVSAQDLLIITLTETLRTRLVLSETLATTLVLTEELISGVSVSEAVASHVTLTEALVTSMEIEESLV